MTSKVGNKNNWYQDKYQFVLVQRNILAVLSMVSMLASLFAVYAVNNLAPLKSVEPFVIQIDKRTGVTEVVDPKTRSTLSSKESLDNYFIWQYIRARETYDPSDAAYRRKIVRVLSKKEIFREYYRSSGRNNPNSALSRLGSIGRRVVSSPTISYINDDFDKKKSNKKVAQIRFTVKETYRQGTDPSTLSKLATIEYGYYKLGLNRGDRLLNPIGFQVLSYRLDEEIVK